MRFKSSAISGVGSKYSHVHDPQRQARLIPTEPFSTNVGVGDISGELPTRLDRQMHDVGYVQLKKPPGGIPIRECRRRPIFPKLVSNRDQPKVILVKCGCAPKVRPGSLRSFIVLQLQVQGQKRSKLEVDLMTLLKANQVYQHRCRERRVSTW
jgi:hypothetical protein